MVRQLRKCYGTAALGVAEDKAGGNEWVEWDSLD